MKKFLVAVFAIFTIWLCALSANAAEFTAMEYTGAVSNGSTISVNSDDATIVYEWNNRVKGNYSVELKNASCTDCTISVVINDGYEIKISDIGNLPTMGFNSGINNLKLNIKKNSNASAFSVGKLELTYVSEVSANNAFIECNNPIYKDAYVTFIDNAGSYMSQSDLSKYEQAGRQAVAEFTVYAPCGGEYEAEIVMSEVGKTYTSDVKMSINGTEYVLNSGTVKKLANLAYSADSGLMKKYKVCNTVTLKEGINDVKFTAIEGRDSDGRYLFYLDYVRFDFVNEVIEITPNANAAGNYPCDVIAHPNADYQVVISVITKDTGNLYDIAPCSFSADNTNYTTLSKGTAGNNFADKTVDVVSEYVEDGNLYGQYKLLQPVTLGASVWVNISGSSCEIDKITFVPVISGIDELYINPDKKFLNPGDTATLSVFAKDNGGCALNLALLQKNGAITFKTSDRNTIAVDSYGSIKALQPGSATVTVSVWDGEDEVSEDIELYVYNESFGFVIFDAKKADGEVKVKLLSPFGTRNYNHAMIIAEYSADKNENIYTYEIEGMNEGEIMQYKVHSSNNLFKILSWNGINGMEPVYDSITIE
ncbi:MAG: hypothetical protein K5768_03450 [Firmicutes bacterium]|nr:hypothetical protein [Bacillota bacterium]